MGNFYTFSLLKFIGISEILGELGRERGYPPVTRAAFDSQNEPTGALIVGDAKEAAEKILRHSEALDSITRMTLQMEWILWQTIKGLCKP